MADDDAVSAIYSMPGTEGDSARAAYDSMPLASETAADVTSRQYQADTATRAYGRIKAADLNSRGIPSYTDTSGAAKPFVDGTGAPLTNSDPKNEIAYDSGGKAVKYSNRNVNRTPVVQDAYQDAPTQTDKQGNIYATPKGLPWVWQGTDPEIAAQAQQAQQDKLNQQTSNALAPYEQQARVAAVQAQRAVNQSAKATMAIMTQSGASLSDPDGNPVDLKDVDGPTLKGAIQDSFDKEYAAPSANEKPWFGGGQYSSAATAIRADIDNRKQKAMTAADTHIDALTNSQRAGDAYNQIQQQRIQLASAKLDSVNQSRLAQGMEPVSIPGLENAGPTGNNGQAGAPSGNADASAPVASQGQAQTAIPGLEVSQAETPTNPDISQEDHQKIAAALPAPAKQALAPVKIDSDGKVQPEGFWATAGRAFGTKIIPSVATAVGGLAAGTLASETGPGAIAADIAGGTAAGYGVAKAQRVIMGDKWANENDAQMAANAKAHPVAAQIGTIVPFLVSILGGGGGGIVKAGEEGALKLGTNAVTQAGKQAVEQAIATGTKAALPTAERVIQSAAAGARGGGGAEAQNPDASVGSVADAMAKNALAFGATGLFAPAKTILGSVLGKAPTDAAAMALAGSMYDTAIHGQPFDIKKIAEQTGANIPAFMLQNALLGFLGHGMAAKSGESGGPEVNTGEQKPTPPTTPQSPIPGIEPIEPSRKGPSIQDMADLKDKLFGVGKEQTLDEIQKVFEEQFKGTPKPDAGNVIRHAPLEFTQLLNKKSASGVESAPMTAKGALEAVDTRLDAIEGLSDPGVASEEKGNLETFRKSLVDAMAGKETANESESPTSEPMRAEGAAQPETQTKGTQVEYAPEPKSANETSPMDEIPEARKGEVLFPTDELTARGGEPVEPSEVTKITKTANDKGQPVYAVRYAKEGKNYLGYSDNPAWEYHDKYSEPEINKAEKLAKEAGVEYQGKAMGLHAFKESETGGNFSIPEGDVTPEKVQAGRDAVKKAFADNPILGVGEHTEADIDRAIALAKTPVQQNEKENTAASKGAPQTGGNEPTSTGGSGADEARGGQAAEITPEHTKSVVTKLRNGKLKPQFDLLQTRLEHLGPAASSTAESGLRAHVNPNTQKLEILHDAAGTADSMKTVKDNWMQRGLSAEDGKKQATQWLNSAMNEELIHARQLVFERGGPRFDKTYAKIWREQIPEPIRQLVVALRNRKESDAERGAEYERMVIQQRETGTITEAHVGSPKYEQLYEALKPFLETPQSGPMEDNIARVMTLHAEHEEPDAIAEEPNEAEAKQSPKEEGRGPPKRKLQRQLASSKPAREDAADQSRWMNDEAKARGFSDLGQLLQDDPSAMDRMAKQWRAFHARDEAGKFLQEEAISSINQRIYGDQEEHIPGLKASTSPRLAGSRDALRDASAIAGGGERTGGSAQKDRWKQGEALKNWAQQNGILLAKLPASLDPDSPDNKGGMEHDAWFDESSNRWIKSTRGPGVDMGVTPKAEFDGWSLFPAAPSQYLSRLIEANRVFGDDTRLHAVIDDGSGLRVVTSQPNVVGEPVSEDEMREAFESANFKPIGDGAFFRKSDNTAVFDMNLKNAVKRNGVVLPIDGVVIRPNGEIKEAIQDQIFQNTVESSKRQLAASKPEFYKEMAKYVIEDDTPQKATKPSEDEINDIAQAYREERSNSQFSSIKIADVMERAGYADQSIFQGKQHLAWMWKNGIITQMPSLDWSLVDDRTRAWGVKLQAQEGSYGVSLAMVIPNTLAASKPKTIPGLEEYVAPTQAQQFEKIDNLQKSGLLTLPRIQKTFGIGRPEAIRLIDAYAKREEPKESFADQVNKAATNVGKEGRFGPKVFVNRAYQKFKVETGSPMTLSEFKVNLIKEHSAMRVNLARLDYPVGVPKSDLDESEIKHGDESYQAIIPRALAASKPSKEYEPFYSQLTKSIEAITQNVMSVEQARAAVTKGAKKDEVEMSGILSDPLSPLMDQKPGASVTKGQLLGFAIERQAKVQDVTLGGPKGFDKEKMKSFSAAIESAIQEWHEDDLNAEEYPNHAADADQAEAAGEKALKALEEGDLKEAISQVEYAGSLERKYGDTPAWGKALKLAESLEEAEEDGTHFSQYQLPGGEPGSYREQFVTWPDKSKANAEENLRQWRTSLEVLKSLDNLGFDTTREAWEAVVSHTDYSKRWDVPPSDARILDSYKSRIEEQAGWRDGHTQYMDIANPIIRIRRNIRTDTEGNKTLFLEEVQGPSASEQEKMPSGIRKRIYEIGIKRAIREAAAEGATHLGWTTGTQQAERYDLSKHVDAIDYTALPDGKFAIYGVKDGSQTQIGDTIPSEKLEQYVGKEVAKKIIDGEGDESSPSGYKRLSGSNLKIGGEGLKSLYDVTLPRIANEIVKKFGAKAGTAQFEFGEQDAVHVGIEREYPKTEAHSLPLPEALRDKAVYEGFSLFASKPEQSKPDTGKVGESESPIENLTREAEHAGVVLKTDELKGLIRKDPAVMAAVRAKIKIRTGEDALWAAKPLAVKLEELSEKVGLTSLIDDIQKILSPDDRLSKEERMRFAETGDPNAIGDARKTGIILDEITAKMDRRKKQLEAALKETRELVSKLPEPQQLELIKRIDEGTPLKPGPFKDAFDAIAKMDADRTQESKDWFAAHGQEHWANYQNFIKNIVPHYFEDQTQATKIVDDYIRERKQMSGGTGFLKHREGVTMREIIDFAKSKGIDLKPKHTNVIDSIMDRWMQQERYFGAHEMIQRMVENGTGHWENADYQPKSNEKMVNNIIGNRTVEGPDGNRHKQFFFASEPSARIVNNYLSSGLRQTHKWIENYFQAANVLNATQLGLSAFHSVFVSVEGMVSSFALGIQKVLSGDKSGLKDIATAPFSTIPDFKLGNDIRKTMLDPTHGSELHRQIVDEMVKGGFRDGVDPFYHDNQIRAFMDAFRQHKVFGTALRAPLALIELVAKPIMEHFVPKIKAAAIYKLASMHLKQAPKMTAMQLRQALQEDVRSGNNRMGLMTYDNLHLHKTVKDLLIGMTRSLGWNWGDISEILGGVADWARFGKNAAKYGIGKIRGGGGDGGDDDGEFAPGGKQFPRVTNRMVYILALPLLLGIFGAILSAMLGTTPQKLKDYFFVKTKETDDHGNPVRLVLPSYMRDVFSWSKHPLNSVVNKLHPLLSMIGQMLQNRDFFGVEIRHSGDPVMKQILQELRYVGAEFVPFTGRNIQKLSGSNVSTPLKIATGIGLAQIASPSAGKSDAQSLADDLIREQLPTKARTQEQADHSALVGQITGLMRNGKGQELLQKSLASGKITQRDADRIIKQSSLTQLQASVQRLGLDDAEKVDRLASPEEQRQLRPMIAAKATRAGRPMYRMSGF